ncbi:36954_t:CDS:2, partial [Gigaspora margarita]
MEYKLQDSTTPEKCNDVISNQKDDGSFEVIKKETQNVKLKSPKSEPWWKTALTLSYLKFVAPDHKKLWEDKDKKAHAETEKELLDCADKYVVDNVTKKVEKDHKKEVAITIVQEQDFYF